MKRKLILAMTLTAILGTSTASQVAAVTTQYHQQTCAHDGSYSVQVCVTMDFNIRNSANLYFLDAETYRTTFTRLDPSILFTTGDVFAGTIGHVCNTNEVINPSHHFTRTPPSSGVQYTDIPSWHGKYTSLWFNGGNFQKVTATLTWRRGTQTYTTSAVVMPPDSGWARNGGCAFP